MKDKLKDEMKDKLHIELIIPKDWTGKQAQTVWEFLESVMESIWDIHGEEIDKAIEKEEQMLRAAARGRPVTPDDFPF